MRKKLVIFFSFILLFIFNFFSTPSFALIYIDSWFFNSSENNYIQRKAAADGAISHGTNNNSYSMAVTGTANASASVSWYEFWNFCEDASGRTYIDWQMFLQLYGDEGEEAEIIADWELFMLPGLWAWPTNLLPSGTRAVASTDVTLKIAHMYDFSWPPIVAHNFHEGRQVTWMGMYDTPLSQSGSFSLGTFPVNNSGPGKGEYIYIAGNFYTEAWADLNPYGSAVAWNLSNFTLTLTPQPLNPTIPEPSSLLLLSLGLLGLGKGLFRKRFKTIP